MQAGKRSFRVFIPLLLNPNQRKLLARTAMSTNDVDFDMSPSRKSSVSQSLPNMSELAYLSSTPGPAIILLTLTAPGALTGRTHRTGEIDERKEIETAKTNVGGVVKEIVGTGTDEAGLARGPTGTETVRGIENVAIVVSTGEREAKVATETATRKRGAERETNAKDLRNQETRKSDPSERNTTKSMAHFLRPLPANQRIVLKAGLLTAEIAHVIAGTTTESHGMLVTSSMICHGTEGTKNAVRKSPFLSTTHPSRMMNLTSLH